MSDTTDGSWSCRGCWELGSACGRCPRCDETRPSPPPLMMLMCAWNDHRNGAFSGELNGVNLECGLGPGALVEFEPGCVPMVRWVTAPERIRTLGAQFKRAPLTLKLYGSGHYPVWRHRTWVGNWCWDQIGTPVPYGLKLLHALHRADWSLTSGPERLFDWWRATDPLALDVEAYREQLANALEVPT